MSLREYDVPRDNFEFDESGSFGFPCCVCKRKSTSDTDEPCWTCDHNANAVKPDSVIKPTTEKGVTK